MTSRPHLPRGGSAPREGSCGHPGPPLSLGSPCACRCHAVVRVCSASLPDNDESSAACRSWGEYGEQTWPPHHEAQSPVWVPLKDTEQGRQLGAGRRDCCCLSSSKGSLLQGVTLQYGPEGAVGRCHKGRRWKTAYLHKAKVAKQDAWQLEPAEGYDGLIEAATVWAQRPKRPRGRWARLGPPQSDARDSGFSERHGSHQRALTGGHMLALADFCGMRAVLVTQESSTVNGWPK